MMARGPVGPGCPLEGRVLRTASKDPADPWLADHEAVCPACAGLIAISRAMGLMHETASEAPRRLPSAGQIWWKARLAARRADEERALRPLRVAEGAGLAVTLLLAFAGLAGMWRGLPLLMSSLSGSSLGAASVPLDASLAILIAVSALIMTMAVHRLVARR